MLGQAIQFPFVSQNITPNKLGDPLPPAAKEVRHDFPHVPEGVRQVRLSFVRSECLGPRGPGSASAAPQRPTLRSAPHGLCRSHALEGGRAWKGIRESSVSVDGDESVLCVQDQGHTHRPDRRQPRRLQPRRWSRGPRSTSPQKEEEGVETPSSASTASSELVEKRLWPGNAPHE